MNGSHQAMQELENAARTFLAPANLVSSEQRHAAEHVFLQLQKTKQPFDLCKVLLEESQVQYVQFQAASLLKSAVIREWKDLSQEQIIGLRNYLLRYLTSRENMENFVREQMVLVLAITIKRQFVDGDKDVVTNILNDLSQLIMSDEKRLQVLGCSVMTALLIEFASSTRASDVGLVWEAHLKAKKLFETTHLPRIFEFCLHVLNEASTIQQPVSVDAMYLIGKFLSLAEQILSWNFQFTMMLPRKLVNLFETQICPVLRPGFAWRGTLLKKEVPQLFFKLYDMFQEHEALGHSAILCINQLCTLNGSVFHNRVDHKEYIGWIFEGVLELISRTPVRAHVVGVTEAVAKLLMFQPTTTVAQHIDELNSLLQRITALTCHLIEMASQEEASLADDTAYSDSLDQILSTWSAICSDIAYGPVQVEEYITQIFTVYLRAHLAPPDGVKPEQQTDDREIQEDTEEDDRVKYKNQLNVIGLMGRRALSLTVPMVTQLLEARTVALQGLLEQNLVGTYQFNQVSEDLHWLIMIAGHLLSTGLIKGETNLIPSSITTYCRSQEEKVNVDNTLLALSQPSQLVTDASVDPVVRLVLAILRLCLMESRALEARLQCSPEVGRSLVWFLKLWTPVYLLPDENQYTELSKVLIACFGRDSEAGHWVLEFVLNKLKTNLVSWSSEAALLSDTCQCLMILLNSMERGSRAIKCPSIFELVRLECCGTFQNLSTAAKRDLVKGLVLAGSMLKEDKAQYFEQLLQPLQEAFTQLKTNAAFRRDYAQESVRRNVLDLIERLTGVVDGVTASNSELLIRFVLPLLPEVGALLELYHNYSDMVSACIQVFLSVACNMVSYLRKNDCSIVYSCILDIMKSYATHQTGKLTIDPSAEEAQYKDLLDLLTLLGDVLLKEVMGFLPDVAREAEDNLPNQVSVCDLAFQGLNFLLPIMTTELLRFPSLCSKYFNFVNVVGEMYRAKMCELPASLLVSIFGTIRLGVTDFTPDVANASLDFVAGFATNICQSRGQVPAIVHQLVQPFLKLILEMSLFQPLDPEITTMAGSALFPLMCCYPNLYKELVESMVSAQSDDNLKQRLAEAFSQLTETVQMIPDRGNRLKFRNAFDAFISRVRGFLCVK
ncbi:exportin-4 [Galendromus occidentalis]|uniref:Exportin-4 n=1 Tax=Galendromus occidentalis TaxID=34638 RepID=A0AAJ6QWW2_9ACAR|nr:exportin-4 [Galendromus occidentalis]